MVLSRYTLRNINTDFVSVPHEDTFDLPEKVLQFGTGVLLRGLPDYFINKANQTGVFNGRIVLVKSTDQGSLSPFDKQDGLYTLCVRGFMNAEKVEENSIISSISRVLSASSEWLQVLECAHNQHLKIIISNTTEVGIQLVNDDIRGNPPKSFPGKLLAFLYERFKAFDGSSLSGMVIIPTELISDNGKKLESIVLELAHLNGLEDGFINWVEEHNLFCNSLVDRIVPGKPDTRVQSVIEDQLGYSDTLLTISEVYRLWAIEGNEQVKKILSFAQADEGIIIEPDINIYRELKLHLLNGTHTLSCGLAFLAGCATVSQAMDDELVFSYIVNLMLNEIAPSIPSDVGLPAARDFGNKVLDRFRNPHISHRWINITMQYSSKMKARCIPVLLKHYRTNGTVPEFFALGFAAYLHFMKPVEKRDGQYYGRINGESYLIQDDEAEVFYKRWAELTSDIVVQEVLRDTYWEVNLHELPGFEDAVIENLNFIMNRGIRMTIARLPFEKGSHPPANKNHNSEN